MSNRRMMKAIAATVRLHNLCVDAFQRGEGDEWTVEMERVARAEAVQQAQQALQQHQKKQELAELAAGGTQGDWGAHRDTDGEEPARAALDAEYRRKAQLLLEAEAPGHARRKRHAKKRAHPEHVAPRARRSEEPVASAVRRAEICAELHAAGQSRSAGKSSAKARARARRDGTGNVGNASS